MKVYDVKEGAAFLRVSPFTVRAWIRTGRLTHVKAGSRVLLLEEDLERALRSWRQTSESPKRQAAKK